MTAPPLTLISVEQYTEKQKRAARRVLDSLDRLDARTNGLYRKQRKHDRRKFRGLATLCFPEPGQSNVGPDSLKTCRVWSRAVSQSGLSFIHPNSLDERKLLVGLDLADGATSWFHAEIVRSREIAEEGFWEYGVTFRGRAVL